MLDRILDTYSQSFDITKEYAVGSTVYDAYGYCNITNSKYVLVKKAELWRALCFEHVFFRKTSSLTASDIDTFLKHTARYIEPVLVRKGRKVLVVAAFASIVANTFMATYDANGAVDIEASSANATTAMISILFILVAILFGIFVYRKNAPLGIASVVGVAAIIICMAIASITPVWILLQPRDYLSSFLLYGMMAVAIVGVIGAGVTGNANLEIPAFTGFIDSAEHGAGISLGALFPALFVTIACGAISGFHSLVGSGTTAKQLNNERDARPIAYGGMLIECGLAVISLCAVGFIWSKYVPGGITTPTAVFATGVSEMCATLPVPEGIKDIIYALLILAVSAFCLTSLDTATRLARYMFQEFWVKPGEDMRDLTGVRKILVNPLVSTIITVAAGIALGMTGYAKIWPLFGAANQLLAALGLMAVATWLGKIGRNNKMFFIPMLFMLIVTITSLAMTIKAKYAAWMAGDSWAALLVVLAVLLIILAIVPAVEGIHTMKNQRHNRRCPAEE